MSYRPKKLYIPANLDLNQLLTEKPPSVKGVNADYLAFICHSLINLKVTHRADILKKNGFVPLNSKILKQNIYSYVACLDYLIAAGILTWDASYM